MQSVLDDRGINEVLCSNCAENGQVWIKSFIQGRMNTIEYVLVISILNSF